MSKRRQHRFSAASALGVLGLALVFDAARADCICEAGGVERAIREADRIVIGTPMSAQLEQDAVRFVVRVDDNLRGPTQHELALTTPRPGACGARIRLGVRDLFVLQPGEQSVSMCMGTGVADRSRSDDPYRDLALAVTLVSYAENDLAKAKAFVRGELRYFDRDRMSRLFELAGKIDRHGYEVTFGPDFILYRGLELRFADGKVSVADAAR